MWCEEISCPKCSSTKIKKNGRTATCKQRYSCKNCGRQFITTYTYLGRSESVRELIVPMTLNGCGVRDFTRVLLVSPNTVLKTLRAAAAAFPTRWPESERSVKPRRRRSPHSSKYRRICSSDGRWRPKNAGEIVEIPHNQKDGRQIAPSRSPLKDLSVYGEVGDLTAVSDRYVKSDAHLPHFFSVSFRLNFLSN